MTLYLEQAQLLLGMAEQHMDDAGDTEAGERSGILHRARAGEDLRRAEIYAAIAQAQAAEWLAAAMEKIAGALAAVKPYEPILSDLEVPITDAKGRTYHLIQRSDGSISFYYTSPDRLGQWLLWDSLDHN